MNLNIFLRPANHQQTLEALTLLANDSLKFRARKDRRIQRSSFRQIYHAIKVGRSRRRWLVCFILYFQSLAEIFAFQDRDPPSIPVKFGAETLQLDSWLLKICYDVCCHILRGGMNGHLKRNPMLRHLLDLGDPIDGDLGKLTKSQRVRECLSLKPCSASDTVPVFSFVSFF